MSGLNETCERNNPVPRNRFGYGPLKSLAATVSRPTSDMIILGINAYHANSSAAIVADGKLLAAVEEERLNRVKYAAGLPSRAIRYCLDQAGLKLSEVDHIAVP